jgi:hypothetical protein
MKLVMKLLTALVLLMVTFASHTPDAAAEVEFKGHGAEAHFVSTEGCVRTSVLIELGEEALYSLGLQQQDVCTGQFLLEAYGHKPLSKSELKYTGNLKSARWITTVEVTDTWRGLSMNLFIDLTWTGAGEIRVYNNHYDYWPSPDCHVNLLIKEKARDAQVAGTVSDGMTNFTPEPTSNARLTSGMRVESSDDCQ